MALLNVELKARDPRPQETLARCRALGAEDHGLLIQRDTYFPARRGRLKLRQERGRGGELIAYGRPDQLDPAESTFVRAPIAELAPVAEALDYAFGPPTVVVSKRRRLLIWQGVRIHLDEVDELGTFLEFEAPVEPGSGEAAIAAAHRKLARLRAELGVEDCALISGGYCDLLLDVPQALLRAAEAAMRNAYAPYSEFRVGAAVRAPSGAIYAGANVENAAYPQSQCAEASALGALVAAGESSITAAAVVAERVEHCQPCGGCRQRLAEFGSPETPVYLGRPGDTPRTLTLAQLLPESFGAGALGA